MRPYFERFLEVRFSGGKLLPREIAGAGGNIRDIDLQVSSGLDIA